MFKIESYRVALIYFLLIFVASIFVSQFLTLAILYPFLGSEVMNLGNILSHPQSYPNALNIVLFAQGFTSFFSMILVPILFLKSTPIVFVPVFKNIPNEIFIFCAGLLVVVSMPANAYIADINAAITLPDWLQAVEMWMRKKEEELKEMTVFLTTYENKYQFFLGLVVVAAIPAIGEELVFRGVMLTSLANIFKNKHVAIWTTAVVFSAIHMQFLGFVPRMLLGALFGYMYVWSQNLMPAITGHFVNNGFTLFLLHMKNQNKVKIDLETSKDLSWEVITISAAITLVLLWYYQHQIEKPFYRKIS